MNDKIKIRQKNGDTRRMLVMTVRGLQGSGKTQFVKSLVDTLVAEGWGVIVEDNGDRPKVVNESLKSTQKMIYIVASNDKE